MLSENQPSLGSTLHQLSCAIDRRSDLLLQQKYKIGFSQFKILTALLRREGVQQREIADFLDQTEASISRQIKLLVSAGLVTSRRDPTNQRQRITGLTRKGMNIARAAMSSLENLHAPMFLRLTQAEERGLKMILDKMYTYICAAEGKQL